MIRAFRKNILTTLKSIYRLNSLRNLFQLNVFFFIHFWGYINKAPFLFEFKLHFYNKLVNFQLNQILLKLLVILRFLFFIDLSYFSYIFIYHFNFFPLYL